MTEQEEKIDKMHRWFGVEFNNAIFKLSQKENLSDADKEEIIHTAHGAIIHWQKFSGATIVNSQRGYYTLALAYVTVGEVVNALKYAKLCYKLTYENESKMADFDFAYACEMMARTSAMNKDKTAFEKYFTETKSASKNIKGPEDLKYFTKDFEGGNWFGFIG